MQQLGRRCPFHAKWAKLLSKSSSLLFECWSDRPLASVELWQSSVGKGNRLPTCPQWYWAYWAIGPYAIVHIHVCGPSPTRLHLPTIDRLPVLSWLFEENHHYSLLWKPNHTHLKPCVTNYRHCEAPPSVQPLKRFALTMGVNLFRHKGRRLSKSGIWLVWMALGLMHKIGNGACYHLQ